MAINKGGRKRLGDRKREHAITLRFNGTELKKVKTILQSCNLDFGKVANYKNMRSPNANLEREIQMASELMLELMETMNIKDQK